MAYTTIDKPSDYFDTKLYTATASDLSITGLDFAPNWIWIKSRNLTGDHSIFDSVRGTGKQLQSNTTGAEFTTADALSAFNSDGFSITGTGNNYTNRDGRTYASWNWKAGTSFTNDASATGIGTIDSTGSVSSDAGFGIVKWSGTSSAGTIAHNMGSTPSFLIIKRLSDANWLVQATTLGYGNYLALNTTDASASASTLVTGVSSTLVTLGNNGSVNGSGQTYIGYFFSEKQGYSKFSSYTGNGNADGTFVYTGFKPAFMMVKRAVGGTGSWAITDGKRDPFNAVDNYLSANNANAESDFDHADFLSNGIKFRTNNDGWNLSGDTYIYMAFASNPLVTSSGVPATAR